jgi:hypothetical protein
MHQVVFFEGAGGLKDVETLQELIAPKKLDFYSQNWTFIGSRKDHTGLIENITTIPQDYLENSESLPYYAVSLKISWASRRVTSRVEDMAYSLLGIFDVQIPLLYGEGGENAFMRLQEEIMKESTDHSIFAWKRSPPRDNNLELSKIPVGWGILAAHPSQFEDAAYIVNLEPFRNPFVLTKQMFTQLSSLS